jgi:hypothetical protein
MAQIVLAEIEAYDPGISGTRILRYGTQGFVTSGRNLLPFSEDYGNADWTKTNVTLTSGRPSPVGDAGAYTVTDSDAANFGVLQRAGTTTVAGTTYCVSWFVKKDSIGRATRFPLLRLSFGSGGVAGRAEMSFDTATGESSPTSINGTGTTTLVASGVTDEGDWWRAWIAASNTVGTTANATLFPALGASASWVTSVSATGSIDAWGAQFEPGSSPTPYVQTIGTAATDFLFYEGRIEQPANVRREVFAGGRTFGRTQIGYGDLVLVNNDGGLDGLLGYSFSGRRITIRYGVVMPWNRGRPTWVTVLQGAMEQVELSWQRVTVRVRDKQLDIAQPLQQTRYAGTGGMEGGAEIDGRPKPLIFGKVFNIAPPMVDQARNIFQIHSGGQVVSVDGVFDRGVPLTAGAAYSSLADIQANAPSAGQYRVWNDATAGCFVRVGVSSTGPTGTVTVDATQGSSRTVGDLFTAVLTKAGVPAASISSADVAALNSAASYEAGVYAAHNTDATAITLLDELVASVGAWYGADASGTFRIGRIEVPTGDAVGEISATEIIAIERVASRDPGVGVPAWKVKVGYQRVQFVQTDLAATVSNDRRAFVSSEYRRATAEDATVKTANLLSPEISFSTLLASKADASAEASRLLMIYKTRRDIYQLTVRVDAALASALDIGKIVTLRVNRFGMSSGKKFLIIGLRTNLRGYQFDLTLWG